MGDYNWRRYQKIAWTKAKYTGAGRNILYPCLGLVGEICDELLPKLRTATGVKMEDEAMVERIIITLGDALWYVSAIAQTENINLDRVMSSVHMASVASSPQRPDNNIVMPLIGWAGTMANQGLQISNTRSVPDSFIAVLTLVAQGLTDIAASMGVSISDVADMNVNKIRGIPNRKEKVK